MIVLTCAILGFAIGWFRAGRVGGNTKDRLQWAFAHMFALTLLGVFATVVLMRMA